MSNPLEFQEQNLKFIKFSELMNLSVLYKLSSFKDLDSIDKIKLDPDFILDIIFNIKTTILHISIEKSEPIHSWKIRSNYDVFAQVAKWGSLVSSINGHLPNYTPFLKLIKEHAPKDISDAYFALSSSDALSFERRLYDHQFILSVIK